MSHRTLFKTAIVAAAMASLVTVTATTASADDKVTYTHCVSDVIGQTDEGEYILSDETCYSDFDDAMASLGLGQNIETPKQAVAAAISIQSVIGVHYDGANLTGSSFSVNGVDCLGGYLNLPAAYDNWVSSTIGGCPRVRHWTGTNLSGSYQDTLPNGNLSSPVNNAASSIQYLT